MTKEQTFFRDKRNEKHLLSTRIVSNMTNIRKT